MHPVVSDWQASVLATLPQQELRNAGESELRRFTLAIAPSWRPTDKGVAQMHLNCIISRTIDIIISLRMLKEEAGLGKILV